MFQGYIKVGGREIPRASLGTAPFAGLDYFGHRSKLYQIDLYRQPENIKKIMEKCYELGVRGVQLIPEPPVMDALSQAIENGFEFAIIGTIRPGSFKEDINLLSEIAADVILFDEGYTDQMDTDQLGDLLDLIRVFDVPSGLITNLPRKTTRKLLGSDIMDLFDIYMIPLNRFGYMMDFPVFLEEERRELEEMIRKTGKVIMAHKVLAAGILKPVEAFEFLKTIDYIDMVTIGVASEEEAEETFKLLFEY